MDPLSIISMMTFGGLFGAMTIAAIIQPKGTDATNKEVND